MNIQLNYKKSKKARRMRIEVHRDGSVVVTSPHRTAAAEVEQFVASRQRWITKQVQYFKSIDTQAVRIFSHTDYLENKKKALEILKERVGFYNSLYEFPVNNIFIRNQKTRWGSCSPKRNLTFNFKLIFLPAHIRDYIVVHELCHLKHANHSKSFWREVAKTFPDHLTIRKELRRYELLYK